jgi:tetratricopeptide (TPR) repeat protein
MWSLAYAYAVAGRRPEAQKVLDELTEISMQNYIPPYELARVCAALEEKDQALKWLEEAYAEHHPHMAWLKRDPCLDPLRSDPRFQDLLRRMKFPE